MNGTMKPTNPTSQQQEGLMLKQLFAPAPSEQTAPNGVIMPVAATEQHVLVTPEMAKTWLDNNPDNRIISHHRVGAYARDMQSGAWAPGHARIVIGRGGVLCNGQHTLTAITRSGVSVVCSVMVDESLSGPRQWKGDDHAARTQSFQAGADSTTWSIATLATAVIIGNSHPTESETKALYPAIAAEHALMTKTSARHLSVAPVRLAAVTRMALSPDRRSEVSSHYSAFIHGDASKLTVGSMRFRDNLLNRSVGVGGTSRMRILVMALAAFDPDRDPSIRTIRIVDIDQRVKEARRLLRKAWAN